MPSGFFHIIIAIALFLVFLSYSPGNAGSMAFAAFLLSSLAPDLDSRNSKIRRYASLTAALAPALFVSVTLDADTVVRLASSVITFASFYVLFSNAPTSHRGKKSLHRVGAAVAVSALIGFLFWFFMGQEFLQITIASFAGYGSHLAIDLLFKK